MRKILIVSEGQHDKTATTLKTLLNDHFRGRFNFVPVPYSYDRTLAKTRKTIDSVQQGVRAAAYKEAIGEFVREVSCCIILDSGPQSNYPAIRFLRRYWAKIIKCGDAPPPVVFLSSDSLPRLIRRDIGYFLLSAECVEIAGFPIDLDDLVRKLEKSIRTSSAPDQVRDYLKKSCALAMGGPILPHDWRNFVAPYLLLKGAVALDGIGGYADALEELDDRGDKRASEEVEIFDAVFGETIGRSASQITFQQRMAVARAKLAAPTPRKSSTTRKDTLRDILRNKRVLLIDNEATTACWDTTFRVLFGEGVLTAVAPSSGHWEGYAELTADAKVKAALNALNTYDLILLDFYLTKSDESEKKRNPDNRPATSFSGSLLLSEIRRRDPNIPVIQFTATTRAFNLRGAQIDGVFQKEAAYFGREQEYYAQFKDLISKCVSQERAALRAIRTGMGAFENSRVPMSLMRGARGAKGEIVRDLRESCFLLESYWRDKHQSYLRASLLLLADMIEKVLGHAHPLIGPDAFEAVSTEMRASPLDSKALEAFFIYQLRNSFAHSQSDITFEDATFAFCCALRFLNVSVSPSWAESDVRSKLDSKSAEGTIDAICRKVCSSSCNSGFGLMRRRCAGAGVVRCMDRAAFLSLYRNYKDINPKLQVFFKYFFYLLCCNAAGITTPANLLNLVRARMRHDATLNIRGEQLSAFYA